MGNSSFSRWYERNKDKLNEQRKSRYHTDHEYREAVKRSSSEAYRAQPHVSKAGQSRVKDSESGPVYTYPIREVASYVGRSVQTIRLWEVRGWIPPTSVVAGKRFYTGPQRELLLELASLIASRPSLPPQSYGVALDNTVASIRARWNSV